MRSADEPKSKKKRGRQSTGGNGGTPDTIKRTKTNKARKSNGMLEQDIEPTGLIGFTEVGEDNWKPPPPKPGSWDDQVQSIDTVVRENLDGELWAFLIWNEKNQEGRFYRSKAKLPVVYKACPQRVRFALNYSSLSSYCAVSSANEKISYIDVTFL